MVNELMLGIGMGWGTGHMHVGFRMFLSEDNYDVCIFMKITMTCAYSFSWGLQQNFLLASVYLLLV